MLSEDGSGRGTAIVMANYLNRWAVKYDFIDWAFFFFNCLILKLNYISAMVVRIKQSHGQVRKEAMNMRQVDSHQKRNPIIHRHRFFLPVRSNSRTITKYISNKIDRNSSYILLSPGFLMTHISRRPPISVNRMTLLVNKKSCCLCCNYAIIIYNH